MLQPQTTALLLRQSLGQARSQNLALLTASKRMFALSVDQPAG